MRASDLALKALGANPGDIPDTMGWEGEVTACSHCGKAIQRGDRYAPVAVGNYFSDTRELSAPTRVICPACAVMRTKKAMFAMARCVITEQGIYPIAQDAHKAWFFLTPPEPPFVAVHSNSTLQHLVWRTPVSWSKEQFVVRLGPDLFTIRPAMLHAVLDIEPRWRAAYESRAAEEAKAKGERKKKIKAPPVLFLDRAVRHEDHGKLHHWADDLLSAGDRQTLLSLTPGELWALNAVLGTKGRNPVQPEPLAITLNDVF